VLLATGAHTHFSWALCVSVNSQRSVKHMDLLIAAAAEGADAGVLHMDEDFERIASITGQPTRWADGRRAA